MEVNEIAAMLDKYPVLKERLKEMIDLIEGPNRGEFSTADAIEERTIGVVRNIGQDVMQNWAAQQSARAGAHVTKRMPHAKKNTKKKSTGTRPSDKLK
jgi:hypothetical protein